MAAGAPPDDHGPNNGNGPGLVDQYGNQMNSGTVRSGGTPATPNPLVIRQTTG